MTDWNKTELSTYFRYGYWKPEGALNALVGLRYANSNILLKPWDGYFEPPNTAAEMRADLTEQAKDNATYIMNIFNASFDNDADRDGERAPSFFIEFAIANDFRPEWLDWAIERELYQLESAPAAKGEAVTSPSGDDWIVQARAIAEKIALERWDRGEREITARNICEAVATELAMDSTTHGTRGERSSGSIRNIALKGWKFIPPTGTNGTSGTKK